MSGPPNVERDGPGSIHWAIPTPNYAEGAGSFAALAETAGCTSLRGHAVHVWQWVTCPRCRCLPSYQAAARDPKYRPGKIARRRIGAETSA